MLQRVPPNSLIGRQSKSFLELLGLKKTKFTKPYIKLYGIVADFNVWIVDGAFVRRNLDKEFTNFGQHHRFKFIPKNEFWIDREYGGSDEAKYFIENLLVENRLMAGGLAYAEACDRAGRAERAERKKFETVMLAARKPMADIIQQVHKKLLKKYSNGIMVWIVDGKIVRNLLFIDFTEGGHDMVYKFIPEREVWIDDDVSPMERKFILVHELHERNLMLQGWCYGTKTKNFRIFRTNTCSSSKNTAHRAASELEYFFRQHPQGLDWQIRQELKKSNAFNPKLYKPKKRFFV